MPTRAAGILLVHEDSRTVLLVRRAGWVSLPGTWCIPGGSLQPDEPAWQGAMRELFEETGFTLDGCRRHEEALVGYRGVDFTTFVVTTPWQNRPTLNAEHTAHMWLGFEHLHAVRDRLHPGFRLFLGCAKYFSSVDQ